MLDPVAAKAWRRFYDAARHESVLDERTALLVHLAAALALGCEP